MQLRIIRVNAIPTTPEPNTIYLVKTTDGLEIHVYGDTVEDNYATPSLAEVQAATMVAVNNYLSTYSLTWNNISNKPATYTPSAHNHLAQDVTDFEIKVKGTKRTFTTQQTPFGGSLTDSVAGIDWDGDTHGVVADVTLGGPGRVFNAPTNIEVGQPYILLLTTGGYTPAWNTAFRWASGATPAGLVSGTYTFSFQGGAGNTLIPTGPGYLTGL